MTAASTASLVDALRRYRLLEPAQLEAVTSELQAAFPDAKALAGELIRRGWLTPLQANHLLRGRGAELLLGSYVLLDRLGEGGMGAVFKARNWKLGRVVAVKLIRKERLNNPDAVRRFQREVRAAAALNHPNIVLAYDADEIGGTHLLVMEHVEGATDLSRLVKQNGPLPVEQACEYVRQAALGLQHAFERGLVHRDVKPANLLLAGGGKVVKVLDMGLARLDPSGNDEESSTMTQQGAVMGTPDYIAPEQALESHTVDIRADLYSLGCTLYVLLTGRVPFPGGTLIQKINKHQFEEPRPIEAFRPDVPPGVASVVGKLMAKRPEDRFQTPAEAAAALEAALCPGGEDQTAVERQPEPSADVLDSPFADLPIKSAGGMAPPGRKAVALGLAAAVAGCLVVLGVVLFLVLKLSPAMQGEDHRDGASAPSRTEQAEGASASGPSVESDRQAAEWVLSIGGTVRVRVNGQEREVKAAGDLGRKPFRLTWVDLYKNKRVTDAGLAHFEECKSLTHLYLGGTGVTNGGLAHFRNCKELTLLYLHDTKVGDAGLAYFSGCKSLRTLHLGDSTGVTNDGLAHFQNCKELTALYLHGTKVTNEGLAHFRGCSKLEFLFLHSLKVDDDGLANFRGCKGLKQINLIDTRLTDAGLAYFQGCAGLTHLSLTGTDVTDEGLALFAGRTNLARLDLGCLCITDAGLANFEGCKGLQKLNLSGTGVTNDGLGHFQNCKGLTELSLNDTEVTAAGLAHFQGCKGLTVINLARSKVADLSPLKDLPLREITCDFEPERDAAVLRSIKTLETINGQPAARVLRGRQTGKPPARGDDGT
jgi:serine/threonine protein kinase